MAKYAGRTVFSLTTALRTTLLNLPLRVKTVVTRDTEGSDTCIYTGYYNVKLINCYNMNVCHDANEKDPSKHNNNDLSPVLVGQSGNQIANTDNQSQVWIDPARSPFVYNHYDVHQQEHYSIYHNTTTNHVTLEQRNMSITQNVCNYNKEPTYPATDEFEHKKLQKEVSESCTQQTTTEPNFNLDEVDTFDCSMFLSQLNVDILDEKENGVREEGKNIGKPSENEALNQLMSSDNQSSTKQRKTILFLGHDSHFGQTIQKIAMKDPFLVCLMKEKEEPNNSNPGKKKYQCDKCKQIFDQILGFRQHMVRDHIGPKTDDDRTAGEINFLCTECGSNIKSQNKFEIHCMSHGNPELECSKCHKVFASKFTLRTHNKIHSRKYGCEYCSKTYPKKDGLLIHIAKVHCIFMCENCDFKTNNRSDLKDHQKEHNDVLKDHQKEHNDVSDFVASRAMDKSCESDMKTLQPMDAVENVRTVEEEDIKRADSVIAKVMSNDIFAAPSETSHYKKCNKVCDVCSKIFNRVGDLKRHLIEHIIKSTLVKVPVGRNGTLSIPCEVCKTEMFTKVDKYKAHLREHANLTIYKCTFCDKSFSDASNFSKHKKLHGSMFLQCDLCARKFNSKRMLIQHIEYHKKSKPIRCQFCVKMFHFKSMLNKHINSAHATIRNKFKCRFCCVSFKALKEKWDHEWSIHNVRKQIADCLICDCKFRKYAELKKHCTLVHNVDIRPARKLRRKYRQVL